MPESWTAGVGSKITDTRRIKWGKILLRYGGTLQPTDTIRIIMAKIARQITAGPVVVVPGAPVAGAASDVAADGFTANWNAVSGATAYRLDVSTSNVFASFVSGYQDRPVGNVTSYGVTGLSDSTTYYFRVRATNSAGTSANSNVVSATTQSGYDAEVLDWVARVQTNGSDVSTATKDAAQAYSTAIAGIRTKILRKVFDAGDDFLAVQVPFIKDKGALLDDPRVTVNPGSGSDFTYVETGASAGLTPLTAQAWLDPGFSLVSDFPSINDCGISFYVKDTTVQAGVPIGSGQFGSPNALYALVAFNGTANSYGNICNNEFSVPDTVRKGFYTLSRTAANMAVLYLDGTALGTNTSPGGAFPVSGLGVFAQKLDTGPTNFYTKPELGYVVHKGLDAAEAAILAAAEIAFATALNRVP